MNASQSPAAARGITAPKIDPSALLVLAVIAVLIFAADQTTKALVVANFIRGERLHVVGDVLIFQYVNNPGAAFGLGGETTWIFSIVAIAVLLFVLGFARRIRSIIWAVLFGLLMGGLLGNLTDRLMREPGFGVGHVVDFISTPWLIPAIYNFADIAIVASMVMFIVLTVMGIGLDGSRKTKQRE